MLFKMMSFRVMPRGKVKTKLVIGIISFAIFSISLALGFWVLRDGLAARVTAILVAVSGLVSVLSLAEVVLSALQKWIDKHLITWLKRFQEKE